MNDEIKVDELPHADVVRAMIAKKPVQCIPVQCREWLDWHPGASSPLDRPEWQWRVKPSPKPDKDWYCRFEKETNVHNPQVLYLRVCVHKGSTHRITTDGETGEYKSMEAL